MIIVKLYGGLGNQLFQYATGRALAIKNNTSLGFDCSGFSQDPQRNYELNVYKISAKLISQSDKAAIIHDNRTLHRLLHLNKWTIYKQKNFSSFDPQVPNLLGDVYLDGYWQSERYFSQFRNQISREIVLKHPLNHPRFRELGNPQSVSVHVRRGDYISDQTVSQILAPCSLLYYQAAMSYLKSQIPEVKFYFFSDDITWVKANFPHNQRNIFLEPDINSPARDLELMRSCSHNIIANSSYSWWAAWLNQNPSKLVIAPKKWFSTPKYSDKGIIPSGWLKI